MRANVAGALKAIRVINGCEKRNCRQCTNAWYRHEPLTCRFAAYYFKYHLV
ncbi:hypothetical protein ABIF66_000533 [Bradyrhizobium japonicum]